MKVTAHIWEHFEGSDDPRAIEGGGGAGKRRVETFTNSLWLIKAYVAIWNDRGETLSYTIAGRAN